MKTNRAGGEPMPSPRAWKQLDAEIIACERCPRLRQYCLQVAAAKKAAHLTEDYWGRPAPNFGDPRATILIIGLAPAAHGANRTGRLFTGDKSGDYLYRALHAVGPLATLGRGYAILRDPADGRVLRSVAGLVPGAPLLALLADGEADLGVVAVRPRPAPDRG